MTAARATKTDTAAEQRKKYIAGGVFALIFIGVLYFELSDPTPTPPPPAPAVVTTPGTSPATTASAIKSGTLVTTPPGNAAGAAARTVGSTSAALDPTLHMQAMLVTESVVYTGSGRNIFAGAHDVSAIPAVAIPKARFPARPGNTPPPVYTPPQPPGPPPIALKFFGTATRANGKRQAFLLHGDDVFLASDGDIVQRKYRIISVGANSVQVEDLTNNNKQTLPLSVSLSATP